MNSDVRVNDPGDSAHAHHLIGQEAEVGESGTGNDDHCETIVEWEGEDGLVEGEGGAAERQRVRVSLSTAKESQDCFRRGR